MNASNSTGVSGRGHGVITFIAGVIFIVFSAALMLANWAFMVMDWQERDGSQVVAYMASQWGAPLVLVGLAFCVSGLVVQFAVALVKARASARVGEQNDLAGVDADSEFLEQF